MSPTHWLAAAPDWLESPAAEDGWMGHPTTLGLAQAHDGLEMQNKEQGTSEALHLVASGSLSIRIYGLRSTYTLARISLHAAQQGRHVAMPAVAVIGLQEQRQIKCDCPVPAIYHNL